MIGSVKMHMKSQIKEAENKRINEITDTKPFIIFYNFCTPEVIFFLNFKVHCNCKSTKANVLRNQKRKLAFGKTITVNCKRNLNRIIYSYNRHNH